MSDLEQVRKKLRASYDLADHLSAISFNNYLNQIVIDTSPEPKKFKDVAEKWQWEQAGSIGPALEAIVQVRFKYHGKRLFWRTMPRGHDKTSSIGRYLAWSLAYCRKNFSAVVAAADKEQASLLTEFMENEARLNPWIYKRLSFKQNKVTGRNNSHVKILAADAYGSFGLKSDIIICDELTHWPNRDLFNTLTSGREKRQGSIFIVITNAGQIGSWQWDSRCVAKSSEHWDFYEAPGPIASWFSKERTKDLRRMLPLSECRRVLDNEWLDPAEDCGFVTRREAEECEDRGVFKGLHIQDKGNPDIEYVASIDYGPKKDRTVCTVGHREADDFIVDRMEVWQGKDFSDRRVPISLIEEWIENIKKKFPKVVFIVDPYQMEAVIQKYEKGKGILIERFEPRGGKANFEMAQIIRDLIVNKRLHWYKGCGTIIAQNNFGDLVPHSLSDEFSELIIKTMAYGYRMDHLPNKHDDRVVSLGMAAWKALSIGRRRSFVMNDMFC